MAKGTVLADELKSALDRLEQDLDGLQHQYELFFSGGRKSEPVRERTALETTLRKMGQRTFTQTQEQFRFNAIQARYYSFGNHWGRTVRDMEEGRLSRDAKGRLTRPAPPADDPIDAAQLDAAARRLAEARVACGLPVGGDGDLAAMKEALMARARDIAARAGGKKIEFRIAVEDGKPKIRAVLK
jgi:hypothetical protein